MKKQNLIAILTLVALAASVDHARAVVLSPGTPTYVFDASNGVADVNATTSSTGGNLTGVSFGTSQGAYGYHTDIEGHATTGTVSYTFTSAGANFDTLHLTYPDGFYNAAGSTEIVGTYSVLGGGSGTFSDQLSPGGNFKLMYQDQTITGINGTSITITWTELNAANNDGSLLFANPTDSGFGPNWNWDPTSAPHPVARNVPFTAEVTFEVIPEPSTVLLFGLGGLLLAWRRRRS